ncbi:MAG: ABC-F family ATP-binding cassette domain-containing protein, partial [Kiloniellaceae bacterium]
MLQINDAVYRAGGHVLLDRATARIAKGERVGLVGRNGSGKTTLLRLIGGSLALDGGTLTVARRVRVGTLAQDAPSGPESLLDTVLAADTERSALLAEAARCADLGSDPARIAEVHERMATIGADAAPARAARILAGLGFDEAAQARPCAALSGGWRMRVALGALLFSAPDLLLLDEPTNHLDLEATLWLEGFLATYPGTLLLVSHDRRLLNRVPGRILHLDGGKLVSYRGGYDAFVRARAERVEHQAALRARQIAERRHIQAFIDRFRAKATKARQAQSRIKALERMEPIAAAVAQHRVAFDFPEPTRLAPPILNLEGVDAGYGDQPPVLGGLDLRLDMDDRIALIGANGNGKSTLMKLLAGRLAPRAGRRIASRKLAVGYFAQDQAEELDLGATPLEHMARALPEANQTALRSHLGRFGFSERHALLKVGKLSGGEKARLLFALMTRTAPHLLLLDEPTNHLDVEARDALIGALNAYPGAVVLVSHDPHVIELTAERLWLVDDGTVRPFDGDMEDYRRYLQDRRRAARGEARPAPSARTKGRPSPKDRRRAHAEARAAVAHLRKTARAAERRVETLTREKKEIERRLADSALYESNGAGLRELHLRHGEVRRALANAEE